LLTLANHLLELFDRRVGARGLHQPEARAVRLDVLVRARDRALSLEDVAEAPVASGSDLLDAEPHLIELGVVVGRVRKLPHLEREQPSEKRLFLVLVACVDDRAPLERDVTRPLKRYDRLSDARRPPDENEVSGTDPAAERVVQGLKSGRDRKECPAVSGTQILVQAGQHAEHSAWRAGGPANHGGLI
jgi:hypothetical protein